jgi:LemA protein
VRHSLRWDWSGDKVSPDRLQWFGPAAQRIRRNPEIRRLDLFFVVILMLAMFVVAAIVLVFTGFRNRMVQQRNELGRAQLSLDQLLKQRRDELPKLLGICRSYLPDESGLIASVSAARTAEQKAANPAEKARAAAELQFALQALFAAGDRVAPLELNTSYRQLKKSVRTLEEKIAVEQARLNLQVTSYNSRLRGFPGNLVARVARLGAQPRFEVRNGDRH